MAAESKAEFEYELLENDTYAATILSVTENLVIPSDYNGKKVTELTSDGEYIDGRNRVVSVTIPNSITTIGYQSLFELRSLKNIEIPNSVTKIEDFAFGYCASLTEIKIPESVKTIGLCAFDRCASLATVTLSEGLEEIGRQAFAYCEALKRIHIPKSVKCIGIWAFDGCDTLEEITVDTENSAYRSIDGNLYSKDGTVLLKYAVGKKNTEITVPEGVKKIGESAFLGAESLKKIHLPDSLTEIMMPFTVANCLNR